MRAVICGAALWGTAGSENPASASGIAGCTLMLAHFFEHEHLRLRRQDRKSDGSQCEVVGLPRRLPHTVWH
jgi:hypothetical protein